MPTTQIKAGPSGAGQLYLDIGSTDRDPLQEVLDGMLGNPRSLPSKFFYDQAGSALFDEITTLDEYYLSRTEHSILQDNVEEITSVLPNDVVLIEYGSGSSVKTDILLQGLHSAKAYVPIDISREHLIAAAEDIHLRYPALTVLPVYADYLAHIDLELHDVDSSQLAVFFPGSTIGNFEKDEAVKFMSRIRSMIGRGGYFMIGVDLKKDLEILLPAYNDAGGVTAAFNLNILHHINNRFFGNFDLSAFAHCAIYSESEGRIEMHLESTRNQVVRIGTHSFELQLRDLSSQAGFDVKRIWTDADNFFSFQLLVAR